MSKIEELIQEMTLGEKVSMLAGADLWHTVPVKRLGIPAIKLTDGPNGARGVGGNSGPSSACFPVGTALGATWNPELVGQIGAALADETRAKGAHMLLAPTVNIHRSPLAGRNFECYSEDPYLTAEMAIAYIRGLQGKGVSACIKHFVCNDSEFERNSISSEVTPRALREIYLFPFWRAVKEAKPWAVMSSYNRVNGTYASESKYLLRTILKQEWGFDGVVVSDWMGTYSPDAATGGLDIEMPGPARWMRQPVYDALKEGLLTEEELNDKVRRILRLYERVGVFDNPERQPETAEDQAEHRELIRRAGGEAIVLLKNEGQVLPLDREKLSSIAVIGSNAQQAVIMGGGSSSVTPHYVVSPLDAIREQAGPEVRVDYAIGCMIHNNYPSLDKTLLTTGDGYYQGLQMLLYDNLELTGTPKDMRYTDRLSITFHDDILARVNKEAFSARLTASLQAPVSGTYAFSLRGNGKYCLFLGGEKVIDQWGDPQPGQTPWDSPATDCEVHLEAGQAYTFEIWYRYSGPFPWRQLDIGCLPPMPTDPIGEAVALARASDVAVLVVGLTPEWESEGFDRVNMNLPGQQDELIRQVAAVNPNTIVLLNVSSPVHMPWIDQVPGVLQCWYLGQESGNAIADVLFGAVNPSGKLPTTFPVRIEENPAYINYPGEHGKVYYGEGIFVGYRYYDAKKIAPLFPFGFGLSYTTFAYDRLEVEPKRMEDGEPVVEVRFNVTNTGGRSGSEVAQVYVQHKTAPVARPPKELRAFAKRDLEPGKTQHISLDIPAYELGYYDPAENEWVVKPGEYRIMVGSSSRDIHLEHLFTWDDIRVGARFHAGLPLITLLENEAARAILYSYFQEFIDNPMVDMVKNLSLEAIRDFAPQFFTSELIAEIDQRLRDIP